MKDVILILYILSFFSGIANITLNILSLKAEAGDAAKKLLPFNIAFFMYLAINFGLFFTRLFDQTESLSNFIISFFDISYVVLLYFWVSYSDALAGNQQGKFAKYIVLSAGSVYVVLWAIVYMFYLNELDRVQGLMGQTLSVVAEVALFVATLECSIVFLAKSRGVNDKRRKTLLRLLSVLMLLYFIWFLIYDLDVVLRFIGPSGWFIYPFDAVILLYLTVNAAIIGYGYPSLWTKPEIAANQLDVLNLEVDKARVQEAAARFQLTPRELEVLWLMLAGRSNNEIAQELTISIYTLKRHINSIFKKAGVKNRHEITYLFMKRNPRED